MAIQAIGQHLGWMLEREIREDDLLKHLQLILSTNSETTVWVNGAQTAIANTLLRDLTQDAIGENFRHYAKLNVDFLSELYAK